MKSGRSARMPLGFTLAALVGMISSAAAGVPPDKLIEVGGATGGVIVHLGCGDGTKTAALHAGEPFLVHGLDTNAAQVASARRHIDSLGLYGRVSAEKYDGKNLPYGDNIVNLIVVTDAADVDAAEIKRVLVPRGSVLVKADSTLLENTALRKADAVEGWNKYVKPWPGEIDQWTHFLYDSSGNAVCKDKRVRRPRHMQWYAGPKRSRHHDSLASLSAMTSSNGRLFYIFDEGPTSIVHRPSSWKLIARDAFNGKLLWKRDIPSWMTHLYNFRAGPKQLPRRLVSVDDHVYVTLGLSAAALKLDAATGKTLLTYPDSDNTEELVYHDGMLLAVIGDPSVLMENADGCHGYWELAEHKEPTVDKSIVAYDAETGEKLWTIQGENLRHTVPLSLCALRDNVFYLDNQKLRCVDSKTGEQRWASSFETQGWFIRSYAPTVVAHDDVIMCLKWDRLHGYSIETGEELWRNKGAIGFGSPGDLFAIGDKAWAIPMRKSIWRKSKRNSDGIITTGIDIPKSVFLNDAKTAVGIDIHTGEITDTVPFAHTQHHHRCYRNKATEQYLLIGHSGIQVLDLESRATETHRWVRGLCQYGIMPANGYIYVPPDTCRCYGSGKINGFFALSESNSWEGVELVPALEKGPLYSEVSLDGDEEPSGKADWPTYRGNNARGSAARCRVASDPVVTWQVEIGGTITAPVLAGDRVFVADRDAHSVYCLDAAEGEPIWKYLANGPVDSPPTVYRGLCIFGCGDGSVYCLDADRGELAWRFKTSKIERRIGHEDRLESPLRIHGSVLVQNEKVYFAAGYSSNLDGGIRLYGLDVRTGKQLHGAKLASGHWGDDGKWGFLADILVSDGSRIGMRGAGFDESLGQAKRPRAIVAATGLLEDAWFHRQGWSLSGTGEGQLIAFEGKRSFTVSSPYTGLKRRRRGRFKEFNQDGHFHQKFTRYREEFFPVGTTIASGNTRKSDDAWSKDVDLQPRAMVLAGDKLCLAGWIDDVAVEMKSGRPKNPANPDPRNSVLRVHSADTGTRLSECELEAEPVFDAMAAANGRLVLSLKNGKLVCLEKCNRSRARE
ncbi:MAG: PQQ-binding-like beta-propeller repeat protein [Pirellulaceae bacterium]